MNKIFRILPLLLLSAILFAKDKFTVSGNVITAEGDGIKKAKVILMDAGGKKVKDGKSKKDGAFELKKVERKVKVFECTFNKIIIMKCNYHHNYWKKINY